MWNFFLLGFEHYYNEFRLTLIMLLYVSSKTNENRNNNL